jgi:hypothetical protein
MQLLKVGDSFSTSFAVQDREGVRIAPDSTPAISYMKNGTAYTWAATPPSLTNPSLGNYVLSGGTVPGDLVAGDHVEALATVIIEGRTSPAIRFGEFQLSSIVEQIAADLATTRTAAEAVDTLTKAGGGGDLAALKTTVDANLDAKVSEAGGLTEEEAEQLDEVATNVSLAKALAEAVKTQTDKLTFTENDVRATLDSEEVTPTSASKTNYALTAEERNSIADALLDRANAVDSKTVRQAMQIIAAVIAGKVSGAGTGTESFTGLDGDTPRVRVTATATGNRSAVEYYPE